MEYSELRVLTTYTGLFDAKRGSDNLEVSYTKFHDHFKVSSGPDLNLISSQEGTE